MWPFKKKDAHSWQTVKSIVFASEVGYWLMKCTKCGLQKAEVADSTSAYCIRHDPERGLEYRRWIEGQNSTRDSDLEVKK